MTMQQAQAGLEWNNCAAESAANETLKINFLPTFERKLAHCQFWRGRFFVTYLSYYQRIYRMILSQIIQKREVEKNDIRRNFFTICLWWAAGMVVNGGSLMERISGSKMDHLPYAENLSIQIFTDNLHLKIFTKNLYI